MVNRLLINIGKMIEYINTLNSDDQEILYKLQDSFDDSQLSLSLLISGSLGAGKEYFAEQLICKLLKIKVEEYQKDNFFNPNLLSIDSNKLSKKDSKTKQISVDEVRKIEPFLRLTSASGGYKVILINKAEDMNNNAANCLLKILEEPPKKSLIILISDNPSKLLPTINSRCRQIKLKLTSVNQAKENLKNICNQLTDSQIDILILLSDNSVSYALRLHQMGALEIYQATISCFNSIGDDNFYLKVHDLAKFLSSKENTSNWHIFANIYKFILFNLIKFKVTGSIADKSLKCNDLLKNITSDELLEIWNNNENLLNKVDRIYLDKNAVIISIFSSLETIK